MMMLVYSLSVNEIAVESFNKKRLVKYDFILIFFKSM